MITRYFIVLTALLACGALQTSDQPTPGNKRVIRQFGTLTITNSAKAPEPTRKSSRTRQDGDKVQDVIKVPPFYTVPFNRAKRTTNGSIRPGKRKAATLRASAPEFGPQPAMVDQEPTEMVMEPARISNEDPIAYEQHSEDNWSVEEMVEEVEEDNDVIFRNLNIAPPTVHDIEPAVRVVVEDNSVQTRMKELLTVSSGGIEKPGKKRGRKPLSRSLPTTLSEAASSSTSSSSTRSSLRDLPTLRQRGGKKQIDPVNNKITEELKRECAQFNAAVQARIEAGKALDTNAQAWYEKTQNLATGLSLQDTSYLETRKFSIKKWLEHNNRVS